MSRGTTRLLTLVRWFKRALLAVLTLALLYEGWLFGWVLWWRTINPDMTRFMELRLETLRVNDPKAVLQQRWVAYEHISPHLKRALIAAEDSRFMQHDGFDWDGIEKALARNRRRGKIVAGGSTISQQLAKNLFRVRTEYSTGLLGKIPGIRMLIMKTKEWIIATKLEMSYDKNTILSMYANTVDFGSSAYGIKTACKTYFNITPKELTAAQSATLVGMLKATTTYNPITHPENSLKRRNTVLANMVRRGHLSQAVYDSLSQTPLRLKYNVETNYDGQANYFREAVADYLKDWCEANGYDLYTSGLKIYTTLDTRMQKYAEDAATKQMRQVQQNFKNHWGKNDPWIDERGRVIPDFIEGIARKQPVYNWLLEKFPNQPDSITYYLNKPHNVKLFDYAKGTIEMNISTMDSIRYMVRFMHCAFVAMEPQTGAVKAWVGDINFNSWKYDKVKAMRQPGSTFKLFVYTEAMNQGLTPCDKRRDEYISMQVYDKKKQEVVTWTPSNANGSFSGDSMPLKAAFAKSINSVAVRLGQEMGIKRIIETAEKMGIKSPLEDAPSLALGSSDVNLLELTNAYCTIANDGMHHAPVLVTRIEDKDGREVFLGPATSEQAVPYKTAFLVQRLLMGGMREPGGTSQSLWGYVGDFKDTDFGGKTGTSNNHSDAWFMAVSPKLVVGAWVGGEYRSIHFRTGALGQGSRTALPICGYFLQSVFRDPSFKQYHGRFGKPRDADITGDMYLCDSYYPRAKNDTTETDSTGGEGIIILDGNGNPIRDITPGDLVPSEQGTEKKRTRPTEQPLKLDEL